MLTLALASCAHRHYFQPDARPTAEASQPLPIDTVRNATAGRQYAAHGKLFTAFFGKHHRQAWATPVAAPVLDVRTAVLGGLKLSKLGGGFNSTSLSTADTAGNPYVIRTVDKDPARATPPLLRGTFLVNYLRDNVSATHPYAALVVPPLAEAVGVAHANPRLFYVGLNSTQLVGDSLLKLRGQLVMVEEKFNDRNAQRIPGATNIVDSRVLFEKLYTNPKHRADAEALLRARLLDAWLGDWDRHAGQWTWADVPDPAHPGQHRYRPVPKDRDMVFYRADDGVIPWLLTRRFAIRHWTTFKAHYTDAVGLMQNGHFLDERLLVSLSRAQFQAVAQQMQAQLTDAVIAAGLARLPTAVRAQEAVFFTHALQARRAALPAFADKFYRNLAQQPLVGGTAEAETFLVQRYPDSTTVTVVAKGADAATARFQRTFLASETKEISLQGLGADDVFIVSNPTHHPVGRPRLRIHGGDGNDVLQAETTAPGDKPRRGVRFKQTSAPAKRAYDILPEE